MGEGELFCKVIDGTSILQEIIGNSSVLLYMRQAFVEGPNGADKNYHFLEVRDKPFQIS